MSEVLKSKRVTIRKPRLCFGCGHPLKKGDKAAIQTNVDNGTIFDIPLCDICDDIVSDMQYGDWFGEGDLKEDAEIIRKQEE